MKKYNIEAELSKLFQKYGVFFAYSKKQFDEKAKKGVQYSPLIGGGYVPHEHLKAYYEAENVLFENAKAYELANNTKEEIILYQLINHEAFYTYDIDDAFEVLKEYDFAYEEVKAVFKANMEKYCD